MAKKRMFSMTIVDSDAFLDMPLSAQCLYFHLNMRADDDGFIGNVKRIMRLVGASEDDFKLLVLKRFVIVFDDGVAVVKHWWMHNTLMKDRYTETAYLEEKGMLSIKENRAYTLNSSNLLTECYQNDNADKDKDIDKISIDKEYIVEIVDYLNLICGTKYRHQSESTKKHIRARLNEGYTVDDFKTVIDKKFAEWGKDDKMRNYLRPQTLFGTKFESYLNQSNSRTGSSEPMTDAEWLEMMNRK